MPLADRREFQPIETGILVVYIDPARHGIFEPVPFELKNQGSRILLLTINHCPELPQWRAKPPIVRFKIQIQWQVPGAALFDHINDRTRRQ
jgi:hypothetical protein